MIFKVFAGIVAAVLLIGFISPVVVKLREPALVVVAIIGIAMMGVDIWQSLKSKDD